MIRSRKRCPEPFPVWKTVPDTFLSGRGRLDGERFDTDPGAEVAEGLARKAIGLEAGEDGDKLGDDAVERHVILELDVEPVARRPAAEEDGVRTGAGGAVGVAGRGTA